MKKLILSILLLFAAASIAQAAEAESKARRDALQADLSEARAQLAEAAARVAEISGELGGNAFSYYVSSNGDSGYLGAGLTRQDGQLTVISVVPESPAAKAGAQAGDVIVAVNGLPVETVDESAGAAGVSVLLPLGLQEIEPGEKVALTLVREGEQHAIEVTAQPWIGMARFLPLEGTNYNGLDMSSIKIAALKQLEELGPTIASITLPGLGQRFGELELVALSPELGSYFESEQGILVVSASKKNELGFQAGDVILDIDGREPNNPAHAFRILRSYGDGEIITVSVLRHGEKMLLEQPM